MKNNMNRRRFLRYTATGGAGLLLPSALLGQSESTTPSLTVPKPAIEQRQLGRTGIKLPILGMGVMRAYNPNIVREAIQSGVGHFDTAPDYQMGKNEEMLGKIFKDMPRDSFSIATKVHLRDNLLFADNAPDMFMDQFNSSMERLGLDYVDMLLLRLVKGPEEVTLGPIQEAFAKLKKDGRIKHCGVATHSSEPAVIDAVAKSGIYEIVLTAYNFRQQHNAEVKAAIDRAKTAGVGVIAMKTMAGAKDVNVSAALKWALQDKNVSAAIPGITSFEELNVCLEAVADLAYKPDEAAFMAHAGAVSTLYCQQCNSCVGQCPQKLPIPDLMRAYMYAHGYRNPGLAKETIAGLSLPDNPCAECTTCTVQCRSGFLVADKIRDISRVRSVPDEFLV